MLDLAATAIDFMINLRGGAATVPIRRHYPTGETGVYNPNTGQWDETSPEWIPPDQATIQAFIVAGNTQTAASTFEVNNEPEGLQVEIRWTIWTRDDLTPTDEARGLVGDEIFWDGAWWRVVRAWPRREGGYTKAVLAPSAKAAPNG